MRLALEICQILHESFLGFANEDGIYRFLLLQVIGSHAGMWSTKNDIALKTIGPNVPGKFQRMRYLHAHGGEANYVIIIEMVRIGQFLAMAHIKNVNAHASRFRNGCKI